MSLLKYLEEDFASTQVSSCLLFVIFSAKQALSFDFDSLMMRDYQPAHTDHETIHDPHSLSCDCLDQSSDCSPVHTDHVTIC